MKGILYLINILVSIANAGLEMKEYQRKLNERAERLNLAQAVREAKIAQEHNKALLLEQKIEEQELKNIALRRSVGITDEPFDPVGYNQN